MSSRSERALHMWARSLFGRSDLDRRRCPVLQFLAVGEDRSPVSSVDTWKRFRVCRWAPMSLNAWIEAGSTALAAAAAVAAGAGLSVDARVPQRQRQQD